MKYLVKFNEHADPGFTQQLPNNNEELDEINDLFLGVADEYLLSKSETEEPSISNNFWPDQMDNTYSIHKLDRNVNGTTKYIISICYCPGGADNTTIKKNQKGNKLEYDVSDFAEKLKQLFDTVSVNVDFGSLYNDKRSDDDEFRYFVKVSICMNGTYGLALHGSK